MKINNGSETDRVVRQTAIAKQSPSYEKRNGDAPILISPTLPHPLNPQDVAQWRHVPVTATREHAIHRPKKRLAPKRMSHGVTRNQGF